MHRLKVIQRLALSFITTLGLLVLLLAVTENTVNEQSFAEGAPHKYLPGYGPLEGCVDVTVGSTGMFPDGAGTISLNVPGLVLDAWLVWTGTQDQIKNVVTDPNVSKITVNGTAVIGNAKDSLPQRGEAPPWYSYFANVGPNGYGMVSQGANTLSLSSWGPLFTSTPAGRGTRRNGASLVVVYDTSPCTRANALYIYESIDFAWWETGSQVGTDVISHLIEPANRDRSGHLFTSIAGIDHTQRNTGLCRGVRLWYEQGTGLPPNNLFQQMWPESIGVNGGDVVADDIWNPIPPCTPNFRALATALAGGYSENGGDYGAAMLEITVPAGATHVAYQLESETLLLNTDPPFLGGESFVWVGAGSPFIIDIPSPDLTVTKTDGVDTADPGDTLTYTIDFANLGDGEGENVVITDTLPDYVTFVSASDGGIEAGGVVTWNLGTLPAGASGSVTLTVKIDDLFPEAGVYELLNSVSISTTTPGDDPSNNDDTDLTKVTAMPELAVTKTAAPEPVQAGAQLTYTINWSVDGSAPAQDLTLTDEVPDLTTFIYASDGGTESGGIVTWLLGDKDPGDSGFVTMIVEVDKPLPNGTELTNTVVLTDEGSAIGIPPAEDTADSTVISDHTLTLDKSAEPNVAKKDGLIIYTLAWGVEGSEPSTDLVLVDPLPFGTQFDSASDGGVFEQPNITWKLGDRNPGESGTVTLKVRVNELLPNGIDIENTAILSDSDPGTPFVTARMNTPVERTPNPGSIGDEVWWDLDRDGEREENEKGIPRVTLYLYASPDQACDTIDHSTPISKTETNKTGWYLFTQLPARVYCVELDKATLPGDIIGPSPGTNNPHGPIDLKPGQAYLDADFGYYTKAPPSSVGDLVWRDENANGVQDDPESEPGIPNVTLNLLGIDEEGDCDASYVISTNKTDSYGIYHFDSLPAGDYCVDVVDATLPPGFFLSPGLEDPHGPIELDEEEHYREADFGYYLGGFIGDFVWWEDSCDGVQEEGGPGIPGVTLNLLDAGENGLCDPNDVVTATQTTGANGKYLFASLPIGTYCVELDATTLPDDVLGPSPGTEDMHGPIDLAPGEAYLDADFGFCPKDPLGFIGGFVWQDEVCDGEKDDADRGIDDVTLNLIGTDEDDDCDASNVISTTKTDSSGRYLFGSLATDDYCVELDETTLPDDVKIPSPGTENPYGPIPLAPGQYSLEADFVYCPNIPRGSIGDFVWLDENGDCKQEEGEPGIYSVTLNLIGTNEDDDCDARHVISASTTDWRGHYLFDLLATDDYCVDPDKFTLPKNVFPSDCPKDPHDLIHLNPGQDYLEADFGYYPGGFIGDFVWEDKNGNQEWDYGETGIPDMTVNLFRAGPDERCNTADDISKDSDITDDFGFYGFSPLAMDKYCVYVDETTLQDGCWILTREPELPVDLGPGEVRNDIDLGYRKDSSTIGGTVYEDLGEDGQHDSDEKGLSYVLVSLLEAFEHGICVISDPLYPLQDQYTDLFGKYHFRNLTPGDYCVYVNGTDQILDGRKPPDDNPVPVTVACGQEILDVDFDYSGVYDIELTPEMAIRDVGTQNTVTATLICPMNHKFGELVCTEVAGVNPSPPACMIVDCGGEADFSYRYNSPINATITDTITGWIDFDPEDRAPKWPEPWDVTTTTWQPIALDVDDPSSECIESPYQALRTITATVTNEVSETATVGATVAFSVSGGTEIPVITKTTDISGQAVFTYTSIAPPEPPDRYDRIHVWVDLHDDGNREPGEPEAWKSVCTAITLASFTAQAHGDGTVTLFWETAVEIDNAGFNLYRARAPAGSYEKINDLLIPGQGTGYGADYSYLDSPPGDGAFYYKLEDVDYHGLSTFHGPIAVQIVAASGSRDWLYLPVILP